jgi:hypothetical protein
MENLGIQAISKPLWQDFVETSQDYGEIMKALTQGLRDRG